MKMKPDNFFALVAVGIVWSAISSGISNGQDLNVSRISVKLLQLIPGYQAPAAVPVGNQIAELNQLAEQMVSRYRYELRFSGSCKNSYRLFQAMQSYAEKTSTLVAVFEKGCHQTLEKASCQVVESASQLQHLQTTAVVSRAVRNMLAQSGERSRIIKRLVDAAPDSIK